MSDRIARLDRLLPELGFGQRLYRLANVVAQLFQLGNKRGPQQTGRFSGQESLQSRISNLAELPRFPCR
jgi:hypothetical protein